MSYRENVLVFILWIELESGTNTKKSQSQQTNSVMPCIQQNLPCLLTQANMSSRKINDCIELGAIKSNFSFKRIDIVCLLLKATKSHYKSAFISPSRDIEHNFICCPVWPIFTHVHPPPPPPFVPISKFYFIRYYVEGFYNVIAAFDV